MTTTDDPREIQRCYELGCSVYVTKPVDYQGFVEAIKRIGTNPINRKTLTDALNGISNFNPGLTVPLTFGAG